MPAITNLNDDQLFAALQRYFDKKPSERTKFENDYGGDIGKYAESVLGWWSDFGDQISSDRLGADMAPDVELLGELGYDINPEAQTQETPLEQGILDQALPGLLNNIEADTGRQQLADELQRNTIADYNSVRGILGQTQGSNRIDTQQYLRDYPDIVAAYNRGDGVEPGMTIDQYAQRHYTDLGRNEGRTAKYLTSERLQQENQQAELTGAGVAANAETAAAAQQSALQQTGNTILKNSSESATSQLGALSTSITALQGNLQGELAAKAAALQQQIAALNGNLDQLDATQRKALADEIATRQKDLEDSVAAQKAALTQQMTSLRGAADAQSQARSAALQQEIAGLTAAQEPLSQARLQSAEALTTAINLGLEETRDQLTADQAAAGYIGGSSYSDQNLLRATIGARQQAAEAMAGAREANAGDTRTIQSRGATEGRSLADELAANTAAIAQAEASGNYSLASQLAKDRQAIGDYGAGATAALTNQTATSRRGIADAGATAGYNDSLYGAQQGRTLADQLATGTRDINTTLAKQQQQTKDATAQGGYGIAANLATQKQAAGDGTLQAKQAYFDNDFTRSLGAATQLGALTNSVAGTTANLAGLGSAGLKDSLGILNWWASNTAAPTQNTLTAPADQSGTGLANLGAGLLGAGLNIGQAQNWWQKPKTATVGNTGTDSSVSLF